MANKNIPLKDKAIVKKRLAMGMSYSKAMEGTVIRSKSTVKRILEEGFDDIVQMRRRFVDLIEKCGADQETRARVLAEMTTAKKGDGKDWQARLKAVRFIDRLTGIIPGKETTLPSLLSQMFYSRETTKPGPKSHENENCKKVKEARWH